MPRAPVHQRIDGAVQRGGQRVGAALGRAALGLQDLQHGFAQQPEAMPLVQRLPLGGAQHRRRVDQQHLARPGCGHGLDPGRRAGEQLGLGVGDADPTEARLVVRGSLAGTSGAGRGFNSASATDLTAVAAGPVNYSIYTSNAIAAGGNLLSGGLIIAASSLTPSDNRLKNIVGESDTAADLQTLNKIKVTNYTMKDASVLGRGQIKKVIAQQVEEVYPQAISKMDGYLPDIYAPGTSKARGNGLFEIQTGKALDLKAGDKVKVFTANGEPVFGKVEATDGTGFTANLELVKDGEKIFVYGRQVNDLRTVDYEALGMLNVSATQELAKKVAMLEEENRQLKASLGKVDALAAKLEAMEKALVIAPAPAVETVSTGR